MKSIRQLFMFLLFLTLIWFGNGKGLYAVAEGVATEARDRIPNNTPLSGKMDVHLISQNMGGNFVAIDIGNGLTAFYAHLIPETVFVKIGDHVKRGQLIGLLGNSGNSDAPHLHFHISNGYDILFPEGVPFVYNAYELQGMVKDLDKLVSGEELWYPSQEPEKRYNEMPVFNQVIKFR